MNRKIPLIAVAVVTVLCIVGVSVAAVAAGGQALAYKVNGTQVSQHDFDQLLDDIAGSKAATKTVSQGQGSVNSQVAAQVMTNGIIRDALRDAADRKGVELTDADRAAGEQVVASQLGANANQLPASYRNLLVETYAYVNALKLSGDAASAFLQRVLRQADVYVNPRYGRWSLRHGVCPPTGCVKSSG